MFKTSLELKKQKMEMVEIHRQEMWAAKQEIANLQYDLKCEVCRVKDFEKKFAADVSLLNRQHALVVEEKKNALRKEMQEDLITSDLKRVEAVARFETYKEMDTKEERKHTQRMLEKAITSLGIRLGGSDDEGGEDE